MSTRARPSSRPSVVRGRRALITGGSSGLGLEFARALASRGCPLVLVARNENRLIASAEELRARYQVDVETMVADLAASDSVDAVAKRLEDPNDPVEILINNAGMGVRSRLVTDDTTEHEQALAVMTRAVLVLGAAAGRAMRSRERGVIVNMGSVAGLVPMGGYSAIKSWVNTYSAALSLELDGTGVQVTALLPGWVRTEFHERAQIRVSSIPDALWLDPNNVVAACLADVEKGRIRSVPSKRFKILAFLAERAPTPLVRRVTSHIVGGRR